MKLFKEKPPKKKRPAAVLDIDNTLVRQVEIVEHDKHRVGQDTNDGLLDALKAKGINDIFLMSNMQLEEVMMKAADKDVLARPELINLLEQKGFTVHALITPADSSYQKGLGAVYETFYLENYKRVMNGKLTVDNYTNDEKFKQEIRQVADMSNQAAQEGTYPTEKGIMYKYFLKNCPEWVDSVLFFDDADSNLHAAHQANNDYLNETKKEIPLTTIHVNKNDKEEYFQSHPKKIEGKIYEHMRQKVLRNLTEIVDDLKKKQKQKPTDTREIKIAFLEELRTTIKTNEGEKLELALDTLKSKPEYKKAMSGIVTHKVKDIFKEVEENLVSKKASISHTKKR